MDETMNVFLRKRRILQTETWVMRAILAEAFLIALWPTGATVALALGIVFWLRRLRLDPDFHFRHLPFDVPISLFVVVSAVSVLVSPDRGFSFYNYYNLVGVYALTYLLVGQNIRTRSEVKQLIRALAASALLVVLYGFYQYLFGIDTGEMRWVDGEAFPELRTRVFSTWENPNILAGYLDAAICVALGIFAKTSGRPRRMFLAASMVLMALCLAMTYARGACFAMVLILVCYGILRDKRILIACLVGGVVLLLADPTLFDRLTSIFTKVDTSSEMRLAIWDSTIAMIEDHPFFGIGWGAFWMVYPSYDFYLQGADVKLVHAHNMYLNYAAEIGIVGALAFFWYFFGTLKLAFGFRDEKLEEEREEARERAEKKRLLDMRIDDLDHLLKGKKEAERRRIAEEQERQRKAKEEREREDKEEAERQAKLEAELAAIREKEKLVKPAAEEKAKEEEKNASEVDEIAKAVSETDAEQSSGQEETEEKTEKEPAENQAKDATAEEVAATEQETSERAEQEEAAEPEKAEETKEANEAADTEAGDNLAEELAAEPTPNEPDENVEQDSEAEEALAADVTEESGEEPNLEDGSVSAVSEESAGTQEIVEEDNLEAAETMSEDEEESASKKDAAAEHPDESEQTVEESASSEDAAEDAENVSETAAETAQKDSEDEETGAASEEVQDSAEQEVQPKGNIAEKMAVLSPERQRGLEKIFEGAKAAGRELKRVEQERKEKLRLEEERKERERQEKLAAENAAEIAKLEGQLTEAKQNLAELETAEARPPVEALNYERELRTWEPHTFCEGVNFGIGMAFISVALNGLTDDLLFNIPTSMLLWLLAALAVCIPEIPKEEPTPEAGIWQEDESDDSQNEQ